MRQAEEGLVFDLLGGRLILEVAALIVKIEITVSVLSDVEDEVRHLVVLLKPVDPRDPHRVHVGRRLLLDIAEKLKTDRLQIARLLHIGLFGFAEAQKRGLSLLIFVELWRLVGLSCRSVSFQIVKIYPVPGLHAGPISAAIRQDNRP